MVDNLTSDILIIQSLISVLRTQMNQRGREVTDADWSAQVRRQRDFGQQAAGPAQLAPDTRIGGSTTTGGQQHLEVPIRISRQLSWNPMTLWSAKTSVSRSGF